MQQKTITLEIRPDDAEPILREAAREEARYGALVDDRTRKTGNSGINKVAKSTMRRESVGSNASSKRSGWSRLSASSTNRQAKTKR